MKYNIIFQIMLLPVLLFSCVRDEPTPARRLIVEGWIDSDGNPIVMVTTAMTPESASSSTLADALIRWGKVTIDDGEREYNLSGMIDTDYFPPYVYTNYELEGKPGRKYRLTVTYMDMKATAVTEMQQAPKIDSVTFSKSNDIFRKNIVVHFSPEQSEGDEYYRVFVLKKGQDKRFMPGFMGIVASKEGENLLSIPVSRGKQVTDTTKYSSSFLPGDIVMIKLARMQRAAYQYWSDYQNAVTLGGSSIISSSYDMRGNIEGGLGYWFAYGVTVATVMVPFD